MIKGKYVARLEVNIHFDNTQEGALPFEEIRENMDKYFDESLATEIGDLFCGGEADVTVTRESFDLHEEKDT